MTIRHVLGCFAALLLSTASAEKAEAATYLFHLSCVDRLSVVQWETGVVDPGSDVLRRETVQRFPNCLASTYNPGRDANLPVQVIATGIGPLQGVPVIGPLVCDVVGCPPKAPAPLPAATRPKGEDGDESTKN